MRLTTTARSKLLSTIETLQKLFLIACPLSCLASPLCRNQDMSNFLWMAAELQRVANSFQGHPKKSHSWKLYHAFRLVCARCQCHSWQCACPRPDTQSKPRSCLDWHSLKLSVLVSEGPVWPSCLRCSWWDWTQWIEVLLTATLQCNKARTWAWRRRSHCFLMASIPPVATKWQVANINSQEHAAIHAVSQGNKKINYEAKVRFR